jgi:hypothetical protein
MKGNGVCAGGEDESKNQLRFYLGIRQTASGYGRFTFEGTTLVSIRWRQGEPGLLWTCRTEQPENYWMAFHEMW